MGDLAGRRVFVAGGSGLVGSALVRALGPERATVLAPTRCELDLLDGAAVERWMATHQPQVVLLAAARVGGIGANRARPVEFLSENLRIQTHVIDAAHRAGVRRLLFMASSCAYPREAAQPMGEDALLSGPPEPTNAAYAVAKAAGMHLAKAYRAQHGAAFHSVVACNLYGEAAAHDEAAAHVIPALMARMDRAARRGAAQVAVWGTGRARREFLHVDDLASAVLDLARRPPDADWINVGSGEEVTIAELAERVADAVGFRGRIVFDASQPDGAPRKLLDSRVMRRRGWAPLIGLSEGLARAAAGLIAKRLSTQAA